MATEVEITNNTGSEIVDNARLEKGKTLSLTGSAKALSGNVTEKLTWATSDESKVKIISGQGTSKAVIEAVAPGKAIISYGSEAETGKRATCEVEVFVPVTELKLSENSQLIMTDEELQLTATLNEFATDSISWTSDKPDVVSIDVPEGAEASNSQTITIKGLKLNESATITAVADSNPIATASCKVTVIGRRADNVYLDNTAMTVNAGDTFKLKGNASSVGGDVTESLLWSFPSDKVECIDGEFTDEPTFRAKQTSGIVTITYGSSYANGKTAKCEVTIINSSLTLDKYNITLTPKGTAKLTASYPSESVGGFVWSSSDENVVKINDVSYERSNSQTVEIVACGAGKTATITVASADDASVAATCIVAVTDIVADAVSIGDSKHELNIGDTVELIGAASSTLGDVTEPLGWTISDSTVASLVGDTSSYIITVKALKAGTVTVKYGSKATGGKTASYTITVKDPNAGSGGKPGGNDSGKPGGSDGGNPGGTNENKLEPGKTVTVAGVTYVVNKDSTVTYSGNPKAKGTVRIPASVKIAGKTVNVTSIKAGAFKNNKNITSVIIGNNVKTIGNNAFAGCIKLKKVTIGKNVTSIGNNAFKGCKLITAITIPAKVTSIGSNSFAGCSKLKTVTFKTTKLKKVGKGAFKTIKAGAKFKCPNAKLKAYTKLLKKSGVPKKAKITK